MSTAKGQERAAAGAQAAAGGGLKDEVLPVPQVRALDLWLMGHKDGEIAEKLGLADAPAAKRLVHAALALLRYRFAREGGAKKVIRAF